MPDKISLIYDVVKDIKEEQRRIRKDQKDMAVDIGKLKVKAGVWGAISGVLPASVVAFWSYLKIKGGV